jgi:predicted alpha/beta hydrolase family esterase
MEETAYRDGRRQLISFDSTYTVKNPLIADQYNAFTANRTGFLVRWIHPVPPRKTLVCLHGYMLGDPDQAQRMFNMDKLYAMGLDLALFITPFHWRRSAPGKIRRGIFLRTDHVGFTCEAMGQTMHDLNACISILMASGAGTIGLIGASLGGYNAALYSCLSDRHAFAAMMVPAVNFSKPYGPSFAKLPFAVDKAFMDTITKVWELHSPLNHSPKLSTDNMLFVASRGDRLCPFDHLLNLQQHWHFPRYTYMTGGHWLVFDGKKRGKAWYSFLKDMGFTDGEPSGR